MIDVISKKLLLGQRPVYEWAGLEMVASMIDGGGADSGGVNQLPHGKPTWRPGTPTTPALLGFSPIKRPAGKPWDNAYMFNPTSRNPPPLTMAEWELEFSIGTPDLSGNAREFEIELCESGWTWNMAWQYKWSKVDGPPAWRMFDQIAEKWVAIPTLPTPKPQAGVFISVKALFVIDRQAGVTWHDSVIIDGSEFPINVSHPKRQKWSAQTNYLHNAVQIDSMGDGQPGTIQIRNWVVRGL